MSSEPAENPDEDDLEDEERRHANNAGLDTDTNRNGTHSEEEEEEDEEPRLRYTSMTRRLTAVYRNGDATSCSLAGGDKLVLGTHNGNVHVLSLPSFESLKVYHAHSATVSAISISPFPPPLPAPKVEAVSKLSQGVSSPAGSSASVRASTSSPKTPTKPASIAKVSQNAIYVASASIDGNVCVSSLLDSKDIMIRNFGRPVHSVSLSPDYKNDRSYLSGGLAGNLILTVGGQVGTKSTSNTTGSPAATASGWLHTIGLSANTGKDTVLHSGEGRINTIKWSLSGKFVTWVNERGIKVMRSNLALTSGESNHAWTRISHIDHPDRPGWEEMAGVWKAHVEWIDDAGLESENDYEGATSGTNDTTSLPSATSTGERVEKMLVGWAGTIWIVHVYPMKVETTKSPSEVKAGRTEIISILRTDCIISGITLYTPNLLVVLAYIIPEGGNEGNQDTPRRRGQRRHNAVQPEVRIIDVKTKEEVCVADTLTMSRFESLSATDYHMNVLPAIRVANKTGSTKGTLEAIGGGIWDASVYTWDATMYAPKAIGGGIWDATMQTTRLFGSGTSVKSFTGKSQQGSSTVAGSDGVSSTDVSAMNKSSVPDPSTFTHGMKIFIHSPYDCVLATKPTIVDHFEWLDGHDKYEEAWNLLNDYPGAFGFLSEKSEQSVPDTPVKKQDSLQDFLADDSSQSTLAAVRTFHSNAEREKRRIGEKWVQQLVSAEDWIKAGRICELVLQTCSSWEHWAWIFIQADRYEEIADHIPVTQLRPPLAPLIYERILGHFIWKDRLRFRDLLNRWSQELFEPDSIISAVEGRLKAGDIHEDSVEDEQIGRDWRILSQCLAKLYLADNRPRQALSCYIRLQDAVSAMSLITTHHLVDAVADDIPGFILLRVSKEQQRTAPLSELESLTLEPIRLLVAEAHHGIVPPSTVISQLESRSGMLPYLYFYFRALWTGDASFTSPLSPDPASSPPRLKSTSPTIPATALAKGDPQGITKSSLLLTESRALVSDHADLAVKLFAEYSRPLLLPFLRSSQSYTLSLASKECEIRHYVPELVYLLSKEGRTSQALRLIIDEVGDVAQAIAFAKEQADKGLWDELVEYSMSKPRFILGLLQEVGTSVDPIQLIKRIPEGVEIKGLKDGVMKLLKEYELQYSLSDGVARVLRGEVSRAMTEKIKGEKKGVNVHVVKGKAHTQPQQQQQQHHHQTPPLHPHPKHPPPPPKAGHCPGCNHAFSPTNDSSSASSFLIAFTCNHVFHLLCLINYHQSPEDSSSSPSDDPSIPSSSSSKPTNETSQPPQTKLPEIFSRMQSSPDTHTYDFDRSIGPKVDRAALLRGFLKGGCPLERGDGDEDDGG